MNSSITKGYKERKTLSMTGKCIMFACAFLAAYGLTLVVKPPAYEARLFTDAKPGIEMQGSQ